MTLFEGRSNRFFFKNLFIIFIFKNIKKIKVDSDIKLPTFSIKVCLSLSNGSEKNRKRFHLHVLIARTFIGKRQKGLVLPRHIVMFILSEQLNLTVERIGEILGGRDHTTVMHGRDKIKGLSTTNIEVQKILVEIKQSLSTL